MMFVTQNELQKLLGNDIEWMNTDERIEYVRIQVLALVAELYEALDEITWKTWTKGTAKFDEERFGQELVDATHFLINLFLVAGWESHTVFEHFMAKNEVNRNRHATGYDGVSTKCANQACRKALDEPGAAMPYTLSRPDHTDLAWCDEPCYDTWYQRNIGTYGKANS